MKTFKQLINILREEEEKSNVDITAGAEEEAIKIDKKIEKRKGLIRQIQGRLKSAIASGNHSEASKHRVSLQNAKKGLRRIG